MTWKTLPDRFFSDEFLDDIFEVYYIESTIKGEFQSRLESAAQAWFRHQNSSEEIISPTVAKKTLDTLSRDANALCERLKNIPDALWSSMIDTQEMVGPNQLGLGLGYVTPHYPDHDYVGEPSITIETGDSRDPTHTVEVSTIISALGELALSAGLTPQLNPRANLTTQKIWPLRKWITDMRNLWAGYLGRKFTRDVESSGEPVSEAACFCVEIFKVLDPETKKSLVLNEMKKLIKEQNDFERKHPNWKK